MPKGVVQVVVWGTVVEQVNNPVIPSTEQKSILRRSEGKAAYMDMKGESSVARWLVLDRERRDCRTYRESFVMLASVFSPS